MMGSISVISLVPAYKSGFLIRIDYDMLRRDAESCNVNISLLARPGDHVVEGAPLAQVWPEQRADAVAKALRDHLHLSARDMQLLREHAQANFYDAAAPDSSQHS